MTDQMTMALVRMILRTKLSCDDRKFMQWHELPTTQLLRMKRFYQRALLLLMVEIPN